MRTFRLTVGARLTAAGLVIAASANAAPAGVKVGTLTCNVAGGMGFCVRFHQGLGTAPISPPGRPPNIMTAPFPNSVSISATPAGGVLVWGVFAPASDVRAGAIQGEYAGASAQATVGVGLGANVLIGGLDKSIALQPVSVEGSRV